MRVSLPARIFAAFAALLLVFGAVSVHGAWALNRLGERLSVIHTSLLPLPALLSDIKSELRVLDEVVEPRDWATLQRALLVSQRGQPSLDVMTARFAAVRTALERGGDAPAITECVALLDALDVRRAELGRSIGTLTTRLGQTNEEQTDPTLAAGSDVARTAWMDAQRNVQERLGALGLEVARFELRTAAETSAALEAFAAQEQRALWSTLLLTLSGLAIGLALTIGAGLTLRPLGVLRDAVGRMARGDFGTSQSAALAGGPQRGLGLKVNNELGDLAADIERMAEAIRLRDQRLADQQREILHQERLATVGRLAAQITHELRNPLSSIGLNSELLMEELDHLQGGAEARTLLSSIIIEVERLREITEAYLGFARLPRPEPVPCDLNAIAAELLDFVRAEMERARVRTRLDPDRAVRLALADPNQVRAALLNLLRNAREALGGREGHIVLRVRSLGDAATIEVLDDGPGFSPDARAHLFEPFYSTRPQGTGLGLSYVRKIALAQGGSVEVEDAPGGGALVRVSLPLAHSDAASATAGPTRSETPKP
jgi:signal transduction histidine kinase